LVHLPCSEIVSVVVFAVVVVVVVVVVADVVVAVAYVDVVNLSCQRHHLI